jgi:8-oxo-dGTP pyrophosphatase MutT (NUDIX family)
MEASHLIWKEENRVELHKTGFLSLCSADCVSPLGVTRSFTVIDCPDWAIVVPVLDGPGGRKFLMVRQWRHGSQELSVEFPGGVLEKGEDPETGAGRELAEETAYKAGRLVKLGSMSPNPAIMSNRVHYFLAENLTPLPRQNLDEDEFVDVLTLDEKEVIANMGKAPYVHSLTAAALALYLCGKDR